MQEIKPYQSQEGSKKEQVERMFDTIAGQYDLLNRILSLGIDKGWRKKMITHLDHLPSERVLDVATGTADVAIDIASHNPQLKVTGIDLSANMLALGQEKIQAKGLEQQINLQKEDCEHLPFEANHFGGITVAFGVRNFENPIKGLAEMYRVLHPGGKLAILEFTQPRKVPFRQIYNLYFKYVLPTIGRLTSKDPKAYGYLYESVQAFPSYEGFTAWMGEAGFSNCQYKPMTFGICSLYIGYKESE